MKYDYIRKKWRYFYRYLFILNSQPNKGFTLLEILIVTIILGILTAIAYPNYIQQIDKARYSQAVLDMDCIADELRSYYFERQRFPGDVSRNTKPSGINCFPTYPPNKTPFNSVYDYDSVNASGGRCYIQITFLGKNKNPNRPVNTVLFPEPGLYDNYKDDLILSLGIFNVPCQ